MKRSGFIQRKKPMARVSKKRAMDMRQYSNLRQEFLAAHPICQVWLKENGYSDDDGSGIYSDPEGYQIWACECPQDYCSTEIHHREKRGKNYLNTATWMAVCRENHERIEQNKSWARKMGFLA